MPLSEEKKSNIQQRLNRDPDFREAFLVEARNMYKKALQYNQKLEHDINQFEQILGQEPNINHSSDISANGAELDIFERLLDAYDSQLLEDEKNASTIN